MSAPLRCLVPAVPALLALLAPAGASAACTGEIDLGPASPTAGYDPLATSDLVEEEQVRIRHTGGDPCAFRLGFFRSPDTGAKLGNALAYDVETTGGASLLDDWPATQAPSVFLETPVLPDDSGDSALLGFRWRVTKGQMVPPGHYSDTVTLRLYEAGTATLLDDAALTFTATVGSVVQANLAGADVTSPYNYSMDFGTLETGERKSVDVDVTANTDYRVTIESEKGGVLQGPQKHGSTQYWTVPYTANFAGATVDLTSGPAQRDFAAPAGGSASHTFEVTIGEVSGRRAGTYSDLVTITVEPKP